jgi:hypothetical protein
MEERRRRRKEGVDEAMGQIFTCCITHSSAICFHHDTISTDFIVNTTDLINSQAPVNHHNFKYCRLQCEYN